MWDSIITGLVDIAVYLFKINAPFTTILIFISAILFSHWKSLRKLKRCRQDEDVARKIFAAQMDHYEDSIEEVIQLLLSNFHTLRKKTILNELTNGKVLSVEEFEELEKKVKIDLATDGEVHRFGEILGNIKYAIHPLFRRIYRANHLAEKTSQEFEAHIEQRTNHVISKFTALLDERYWEGTKPDRVTLYDSQQLLMPKCKDLLKNILRHGKQIAEEYRNNEDIASEHFVTEVIGG